MTAKNGNANTKRRNSSVTGLTEPVRVGTAYASFIQIGRSENASTLATASPTPQARYLESFKEFCTASADLRANEYGANEEERVAVMDMLVCPFDARSQGNW